MTVGIIYEIFRIPALAEEAGCTFKTHEGGSGHIHVFYKDKITQLPAHGAGKELKKGLVEGIKKQLGLK